MTIFPANLGWRGIILRFADVLGEFRKGSVSCDFKK